MAMEIITTTDKTKRDQMFQDLKYGLDSAPEEKQVTKFSGVQLSDGSPAPQWESNYSVAYPSASAGKLNHGSKLRPRTFASRKAAT